MNLEIKHLVAYLPYGLKVYDVKNEVHTMISVVDNGFNKHIMTNLNAMMCTRSNIEHCKPILRPLESFSDLEVLSIKKVIGIENWVKSYDDYFDIWLDHTCDIYKYVLQSPYEIFQYFLENHYDVFNLIGNNLAINTYTIKCLKKLTQ